MLEIALNLDSLSSTGVGEPGRESAGRGGVRCEWQDQGSCLDIPKVPSEVIVGCKLSCMGALAPENEHRSRKRETHNCHCRA